MYTYFVFTYYKFGIYAEYIPTNPNETTMNTQAFKKRPADGSATGRVWAIADDLAQRLQTLPSGRQVADIYLAESSGHNEGTAFTQYSHWKKTYLARQAQVRSVADEPAPGQLRVGADGSLTIPASLIALLGLQGDKTVVVSCDGRELHIAAPMTALQKLQNLLRPLAPNGQNLSDVLIVERRAEARLG